MRDRWAHDGDCRDIARRALAMALLVCALGGAGAKTAAQGIRYTYDDTGRLVKVDYGGGGYSEYTYDQNGNRLHVKSVPPVRTPVARTLAPQDVGPNRATLSGLVNLYGTAGQAWFEWGQPGEAPSSTPRVDVPERSRSQQIGTPVTGLAPNTRYDVRVMVRPSPDSDPTAGEIVQFRTLRLENRAPVARDDAVAAAPGQARTFDPRGNDEDADGDPITIVGVGAAASGFVTFTADTVTYAPRPSFVGVDAFTYTVSDGQGGTSQAIVSVSSRPQAVAEGSPFFVNTYKPDSQQASSVAAAQSGTSIAVWESRYSSGSVVAFRRFGVDWKPLGDEVLVDRTTLNDYEPPAITADEYGNAIVAWPYSWCTSRSWWGGADLCSRAVYARRIAADGTQGPRETLALHQWNWRDTTDNSVRGPIVLAAGATSVIAAWSSWESRQAGQSGGVFVKVMNADLTTRREVFIPGGVFPQVAAAPSGRFVVVWQDASRTVRAQRYSRDGTEEGSAIRLDSTSCPSGCGSVPVVSADRAGRVAIAWVGGRDVWVRLLNPDLEPAGPEFRANTTMLEQSRGEPAVALAPDGRLIVIWEASVTARNPMTLWARAFAHDGTPVTDQTNLGIGPGGPGLSVPSGPGYRSVSPVGAVSAFGESFVVTWSQQPDPLVCETCATESFAQRFVIRGWHQTPDLAPVMTHAGDFVAGTRGEYRIRIDNLGQLPVPAPVSATITLGLSAGQASNITAVGPDWTCEPRPSADPGQTVMACSYAGALAPGGSSTDLALGLTISNAAPAVFTASTRASVTGDGNPDNDVAADPTAVRFLSDLALSVSGTPAVTPVRREFVIPYTVTNAGPSDARGATLRLPLPPELWLNPVRSTAGCVLTDGMVTCDLGTLTPRQSRSVDLVVTAGSPGVFRLSAVAMASTQDPDGLNNGVVLTVRARSFTRKRVSVSTEGTQGNSHSSVTSLSADGRYVAFVSDAWNLVGTDANSRADLFVHDRFSAETTRVSVGGEGVEATEHSNGIISGNGRYVVFETAAANLVAGDTNHELDSWCTQYPCGSDVFVHDRVTGGTTRVSVGDDEAEGNGESGGAAISGDGRFVAFTSTSTNLVPGGTVGRQVFLRDLEAGETLLVSQSPAGEAGDRDSSGRPWISADGRFVLFYSEARNLTTDGLGEGLFLRDRFLNQLSRVPPETAHGRLQSSHYSMSRDGRWILYTVVGTVARVLLHDRILGTTRLVSATSAGVPLSYSAWAGEVSDEGRFVSYVSDGRNFGLPCTGPSWNPCPWSTVRWESTSGTSTRIADTPFSRGVINSDGRVVAFTTRLAYEQADTNGDDDVYVFASDFALVSVAPDVAREEGGATITLTGAGFEPAMSVLFGGIQSPLVDVVNGSLATALAPAHSKGIVDVSIVNADGESATLSAAFTYGGIRTQGLPPTPLTPTVSGISPASGGAAGGTAIEVTGASFQPGATVLIGGSAATDIEFVSATRLAAITPPGMPGASPVVVRNPAGLTSSQTVQFTYAAGAVSVDGVSPATGPVSGGTRVTVSGQGFSEGVALEIGGQPAAMVTRIGSSLLVGTTAPHEEGPVSVVVRNPDGSSASRVAGFTYQPVLTAEDRDPPQVSVSSHTHGQVVTTGIVTIRGTATDAVTGGHGVAEATVNYVRAADDRVAGSAVANWHATIALVPGVNRVVVAATDDSPNHNTATVSLELTWDAGPPPAIAALTPSGLVAGSPDFTLIVDGANFKSGTTVLWAGHPRPTTFIDATRLHVAIPSSDLDVAGPVQVRVLNPDPDERMSAALPFTVAKITPVLTWGAPAAIVQGAALSSAQLNATASVSGTFVYTPAEGTVLPTGTHSLSTTFTPTDTTNYTPATASVTLAVTANPPTLLLSPMVLNFAGTNTNGTLSPVTGAQAVTVSFSPAATTGWIATANQPWVQITGGAGTGSGTFAVAIVNPGNQLAGVTHTTATVTVVAPGAVNTPRTIAVALTLREPSATTGPVGLVDTPAPNTTGVVGTIGVTGWVVDDVGVAKVEVYRSCLAFEPAINCSPVKGRDVVFVGNATLVEGARPDVESLYPSLPQAGRAAWGYLLLTNLLPHIPNQAMFGGQGTFTFHALATDVEGKQTWLGRGIDNETPTTITLANDTITKPFGAIDTPAQGATVSGTFANFGWALTPDTNTVSGDAGDIVVPADGSTLRVYIDGVPGATIAYNQCRGTTAAGPVPAGVYCDDDVASIFGHASPQATFTVRTGNPTPHRNLDAGRGAIGALLIDTRTLTNGVHTIMWGVTDSAGRGEGLGSRYFTVLNTGADRPATDGSMAKDAGPTAHGWRPAAKPEMLTAAGQSTRAQHASNADPGVVRARTGLDVESPWVPLEPGADGVRHVTVPPIGRVAIALGAGVDAAHLLVNGEPRPLPPGSHFDPQTGVFTWAPGVGYSGTYRLVFERAGAQVVFAVTIGQQ